METTKSATKRSTKPSAKAAPKKAAPRKSTAKSAVASVSKTRKTAKKSKTASQGAQMKSFRIASDGPFTQFSVSKQTVYWVILICFIIFAQLWILKLQLEVADLVDQQQQQLQSLQDSQPVPKKR